LEYPPKDRISVTTHGRGRVLTIQLLPKSAKPGATALVLLCLGGVALCLTGDPSAIGAGVVLIGLPAAVLAMIAKRRHTRIEVDAGQIAVRRWPFKWVTLAGPHGTLKVQQTTYGLPDWNRVELVHEDGVLLWMYPATDEEVRLMRSALEP